MKGHIISWKPSLTDTRLLFPFQKFQNKLGPRSASCFHEQALPIPAPAEVTCHLSLPEIIQPDPTSSDQSQIGLTNPKGAPRIFLL